jgi:Tol biopolymer transport system component
MSAQYFGRQKVQYDRFEWQVLRTPRFRVHYYPAEEAVARDAARMAERWYVRHAGAFQHEFESIPLIFYADAPDFQQTNVISGLIGEGTGGVTEPLRTRVIMPFTGVYAENDHVLGHELVHVFQFDVAQSGPEAGGLTGIAQLPLWLVEGMAEYLSLGRNDAHTAMWMRDAALRGELPTIAQLTRDYRYFPYRYGQALLAYIGGKWGDRAVVELYRVAAKQGVEAAFRDVLGVTPAELSDYWITAVRAAYLPVIEGKQRPADAGDPVIVDPAVGAMNLAPAVSPDGRYVAYFGRRNVFTVDLLLADAQTGKLIRKLSSPTSDDHYDALSFIASTGTWSPDSRRFAFVVFEKGDHRVDILDVQSARVVQRIAPEGVSAIQNLAWSPDGNRMVFAAMRGGQSDLYLLELETGALRQLTNDRYADLQPAWSPDGRTLAFVTDRATGTDLDALRYGALSLGLLDLASGFIAHLCVFEGAKHIDPHFAPDGRNLYFLSDADGFNDIYRVELATQAVFRVTRVATGVSGITALSPAFSVASRNGRLLFSVFENAGNNIYGLDAADAQGERVPAAPARATVAGVLPPFEAAGTGMVHDYLQDPVTGLPDASVFLTERYRARLGLDYLGPPSIGVGFGGYGTLVGGSASAWFGDMLGDRLLALALSASGTYKDIAGQAVYQNLAHRLNWGAAIAHIPYLTGFARLTPATADDGSPVTVVDQYLDRVYVDQAQALLQFPLSTTRRFELSGGYTRYAFDLEIERYVVNRLGVVLSAERFDTTARAPLHFAQASLGFVMDNSYFGFTSPLLGSRSRFEITPTVGSLSYYVVLADHRRYFMTGPVTLALRGLHYGRYGRNASGIDENGERVLWPLYLGDAYLIRGYTQGTFSGQECRPAEGTSDCPAFDRLIGSRLAVANFEVRIPLIGNERLGLLQVPFVPTEIAPFLDAGLAWSSGDDVTMAFVRDTRRRVPVFSAGVSARVNILGYIVLETYFAYPFQRPDKGGHFGLQINPGW